MVGRDGEGSLIARLSPTRCESEAHDARAAVRDCFHLTRDRTPRMTLTVRVCAVGGSTTPKNKTKLRQ